LLSRRGEVWAKLDAGTEEWHQKVNQSRVPLDRIEANLVQLGCKHPFKLQSLFCRIAEEGWNAAEIEAYLRRLERIHDSGARILETQLHTLARRPSDARVSAVDSAFLEAMRGRIEALGIKARVYGSEG
jgi:hypothetical protein